MFIKHIYPVLDTVQPVLEIFGNKKHLNFRMDLKVLSPVTVRVRNLADTAERLLQLTL